MMQNENEHFPKLDDEVASSIITSVFEACGQTPSTVPLSVLSSYTEYRRDRFSLQKGILIFILIVFLLLPICFIYPHFTVTEVGRSDTGIPTYEVRVNNILPVRLVSARLNDRSVTVFESDAKIFSVEPADNGHLTITVTLMNRQFDVWNTDVTGVDATAPVLLRSSYHDDTVRIYLEDTGVGVDYENCYAVAGSGSKILPAAFNSEKNYVEFIFDQNMNIYIPDFNGNQLQLVLTVQ